MSPLNFHFNLSMSRPSHQSHWGAIVVRADGAQTTWPLLDNGKLANPPPAKRRKFVRDANNIPQPVATCTQRRSISPPRPEFDDNSSKAGNYSETWDDFGDSEEASFLDSPGYDFPCDGIFEDMNFDSEPPCF